MAGLQWLVLRERLPRLRAAEWIGATVALAMTAIFFGASLPTAESPGWLIAILGTTGGLLGGILLGAVTGLVAKELRPLAEEHHSFT
ncbi:MAG: hypothetical protein ABL921_18085 [Pirellula sp.]